MKLTRNLIIAALVATVLIAVAGYAAAGATGIEIPFLTASEVTQVNDTGIPTPPAIPELPTATPTVTPEQTYNPSDATESDNVTGNATEVLTVPDYTQTDIAATFPDRSDANVTYHNVFFAFTYDDGQPIRTGYARVDAYSLRYDLYNGTDINGISVLSLPDGRYTVKAYDDEEKLPARDITFTVDGADLTIPVMLGDNVPTEPTLPTGGNAPTGNTPNTDAPIDEDATPTPTPAPTAAPTAHPTPTPTPKPSLAFTINTGVTGCQVNIKGTDFPTTWGDTDKGYYGTGVSNDIGLNLDTRDGTTLTFVSYSPGDYIVTVSKAGYNTVTTRITNTGNGGTFNIIPTLTVTPIPSPAPTAAPTAAPTTAPENYAPLAPA